MKNHKIIDFEFFFWIYIKSYKSQVKGSQKLFSACLTLILVHLILDAYQGSEDRQVWGPTDLIRDFLNFLGPGPVRDFQIFLCPGPGSSRSRISQHFPVLNFSFFCSGPWIPDP